MEHNRNTFPGLDGFAGYSTLGSGNRVDYHDSQQRDASCCAERRRALLLCYLLGLSITLSGRTPSLYWLSLRERGMEQTLLIQYGSILLQAVVAEIKRVVLVVLIIARKVSLLLCYEASHC